MLIDTLLSNLSFFKNRKYTGVFELTPSWCFVSISIQPVCRVCDFCPIFIPLRVNTMNQKSTLKQSR